MLRVAKLIDKDTWQWVKIKVYEFFAPRTRSDILAIPLCYNRPKDKLIWKENNKHEFSMKTTYHVALRLCMQVDIDNLRAQKDGKWWKMTQVINVPSKVKTYIWRVCSNILPTQVNLQRRKIQVDQSYKQCCQQAETCAHLLWECPFARNV